MPILQVHNLCHHFENGDVLFNNLSCTLTYARTGLIGKNGVGKSQFAALISGERNPTSGSIVAPRRLAVYHQQDVQSSAVDQTIADYIGKSNVLGALQRVAEGDCTPHLFDIIADQWDLEHRLAQQLHQLDLPADPLFPCSQLSGGELARLKLWQLFESDNELLILDEPSNHLDSKGKEWLRERIDSFEGVVLLISHDLSLLRKMQEIWELSPLGLRIFGGNYDNYVQQNLTELQAIERKLTTVEQHHKQLKIKSQKNREKAAQRANQGKQLRRSGSQPKVLQDSKKDKATASVSSRNKNEQNRTTHLQKQISQLKARQIELKPQRIYLSSGTKRGANAILLTNLCLPFGTTQPLNISINTHDKVHIKGCNGSGKSTFLKTLLGIHAPVSGTIQINTPLYYLDQYFECVLPDKSLLENLLDQCTGLDYNVARILLAGIGFRGDSVHRKGRALSGGEKMKLALLIVSHQIEEPMLLLDEPDNHLDIESKQALATVLNQYQGGFLIISHDDDFIDACKVNREVLIS